MNTKPMPPMKLNAHSQTTCSNCGVKVSPKQKLCTPCARAENT